MGVARALARIIVGLAGLFLAANTAWMAFTTNLNLGVVFEAVAALACLAWAAIGKLSTVRWLTIVAAVAVAGLAGVIVGLHSYGSHDTADGSEDVLIVLGAALHGREVSPTLSARLDVAVGFHQRNPSAFIIVTGGQGPQEDIPEAIAAREYLLARGVADDRILVEQRSTSTEENFRFAQAVYAVQAAPDARFAFVTNEFHVWRAGQVARQTGLTATHLSAPTLWYVLPSSYLREVVAIGTYLLGAR